MKKANLVSFFLALIVSCLSFAQSPGGVNNQLEAKRDAWRTWRSSHSHVLSLQHTVLSLASLQDNPVLKVDAKQASAILEIFDASGDKLKLSDKQAKKIDQQMQSLLSEAQIGAIKRTPRLYTSPPKPTNIGLPGSGRPILTGSSFPWPKDYNPLNPETAPFPIQRREMLATIRHFKIQLQNTSIAS